MSDLERFKDNKTLMVQGTSSDVGKTLITAGLCRILQQEGYTVAPFKAKNIALNSGVTPTGEEMARGQIVQAEAARIMPEAIMNPILIKAQPDSPPQYVINGAVAPRPGDKEWSIITDSLDTLRSRFELVVIEGMGSPAELGFMQSDNANMRVARYAKSPVLLVGNIERGGVWANLRGTVDWLRDEDSEGANLIRGLIINKADKKYLSVEALDKLTYKTGLPVFGVIPEIKDHRIPDEDITSFDQKSISKKDTVLDIAVIQIPSLQNTDDIDPLIAEPGVQVRMVSQSEKFGSPDLVVLGGSKGTVADLEWMRRNGLADLILEHATAKQAIIGICGGYQMLGRLVLDPYAIESPQPTTPGLNLLPSITVFENIKMVRQIEGTVLANHGLLSGAKDTKLSGYEIHMGRTELEEGLPFSQITRRGETASITEGAINQDGLVIGTYIHGILANDIFRANLLRTMADRKGVILPDQRVVFQARYDLLADTIRANIDMNMLNRMIERPNID